MLETSEYNLEVEGPRTLKTVNIPLGVLTIGRQPGNELELSHPMVSRRHAQIECSTTGCQIIDLGSANGTKVDGEKLKPQVAIRLTQESVISIGPFTLTLKVIAARSEPDAEIKVYHEDVQDAKVSPEKLVRKPEARSLSEVAEPVAVPPSTPTPPAPPQKAGVPSPISGDGSLPADIFIESTRLINYLPSIYHNSFMLHFLGLFESIWMPIEWNVDNYDLFLDPGTAPVGFLPWLAQWFEITFDTTWDEGQRRTFIREAHQIYAMRGTRWSLCRALQIYIGSEPQIMDCAEDQEPFTFTVDLPVSPKDVNADLVEAIIDACKPAHTTYTLTYKE